MPDITMCQNSQCPIRLECYRYMAMPNEHIQSYSDFVGGDKCDGFKLIFPEEMHMMKKYHAEMKDEK
ncbi:MAG TPA: hypothetical protein VFM18_14655 [Methanosarcina sp.]|nr:hypothetical protein [Methanosarcina sp.]